MNEVRAKTKKTFQMPPQLAGKVELMRVIREIEELDDFLYQANLRSPGSSLNLPQKTSHLLEKLAETNHYSLLDQSHRELLLKGLRRIDKSAPKVHISFAGEPSAKFMAEVVAWMRENVHQYLLVEVGLQPTISVGCVIRTNNKIFDLSLRNKFYEYRSVLIDKIAENPRGKNDG